MDESDPITVKTSEIGWLKRVAEAYQRQSRLLILDDAKLGINPQEHSIAQMAKLAGLTPREWAAVAVGVGISTIGAYLIVMAILDPEPFSKLGVALGAGTAMALGGGFTAIRVLTHVTPPNVKLTPRGIEISWS